MNVGLVGDSQGVGLRPHLAIALTRAGANLAAANVETGATLRKLAANVSTLPTGLDVLVIVSGGGNDDPSSSSWAGNVGALVTAAKARQPKRIVWVGPMPARAGLEAQARKVQARAQIDRALAGVPRIDGFELAKGLSPSSADGVHFDSSSYRTMAERLAPQLLSSGPSPWVVAGAAFGALAGLAALGYAFTKT